MVERWTRAVLTVSECWGPLSIHALLKYRSVEPNFHYSAAGHVTRFAGSTELGCPIAQRIIAQQTAQNVWTAATGLLSTLSCARAAIRRRHTDMHDNTGSPYSNSVLSHARIPHSGNAVTPDYGLKTELAPRNLY
ncbi:hypothetical protein BaRGS_00035494 [Batillaria attramentaria]|uniref:Uncharacterized protein n=1 Tax=Batillaria attramentaria TaxID=370345 RepID=A0ABD0JEF9_9CAEN